MTVSEIELAYNLSVTRKLEDCDFYGNFSPLYVGKVLSAYEYYRKLTMAEAIRKKERFEMEEMEKKSRLTPEEEVQLTKEIIFSLYKESKETNEVNDPFNIAYNLFRKHGWMKVTQEDIDGGMKAGKDKYQSDKQKEGLFKQIDINPEITIKRHARNHIVKKYFENVDIDILINNIVPELFCNLDQQ